MKHAPGSKISLFVVAVICVTSGAAWSAPQGKSPPAKEKEAVAEQLKAALIEAKPRLGELDAFQNKVFDEEVPAQYSRFIKDYRPAPGGIQADIDIESIKKYLSYCAPKNTTPDNPSRILVYLKADNTCESCTAALPQIKKIVSERLARRGFLALVAPTAEMEAGQPTGAALSDRLTEGARKRGLNGALLLHWYMLPPDIDSAHADEKHYQIDADQVARLDGPMSTSGVDKEIRSKNSLETLENDSLAAAAERVMVDAFSEVGARVAALQTQEQPDAGAEELAIVVAPVRDFQHYQTIKSQIAAALKGWSAPEERKLTRGQAQFAVRSRRKVAELAQALSSLGAVVLDSETVKIDAR